MKLRVLSILVFFLFAQTAFADTNSEIRARYQGFANAQNARDSAAIASFFIQSPKLLWVSDGKSYWGVDAVIKRMSAAQESEIWRVTPHLDRAEVVEVNPGAAYLHMPLDLVFGPAKQPENLAFLVSILWVKADDTWKIAALFTTNNNSGN